MHFWVLLECIHLHGSYHAEHLERHIIAGWQGISGILQMQKNFTVSILEILNTFFFCF